MHFAASAPASDTMGIVREYDEAERQHPESENGKKTEKSSDSQRAAEHTPHDDGLRHGDSPTKNHDRFFSGRFASFIAHGDVSRARVLKFTDGKVPQNIGFPGHFAKRSKK